MTKRAASPSFVATFADGEVTRMTTYCADNKLDLARGLKLSRHAYQQRITKEPPAIVEARFEDAAGAVLGRYDAKQIAEVP
jgi:hypothetical protein